MHRRVWGVSVGGRVSVSACECAHTGLGCARGEPGPEPHLRATEAPVVLATGTTGTFVLECSLSLRSEPLGFCICTLFPPVESVHPAASFLRRAPS